MALKILKLIGNRREISERRDKMDRRNITDPEGQALRLLNQARALLAYTEDTKLRNKDQIRSLDHLIEQLADKTGRVEQRENARRSRKVA
jgi:hypothetical protein